MFAAGNGRPPPGLLAHTLHLQAQPQEDPMPNSNADMNKPMAGESTSNGVGSTSAASASAKGTSAVDLLKADHRAVEQMFAQFENAEDAEKDRLAMRICKALTIHVILEEEIFYPACRGKADDEDPLDEAQVEHDSAKVLIADIWGSRGQDRFRDAKVKVLAEQIRHHVQEEEKARSGIMARAMKDGVDMNALGARIASRKAELESRNDLAPLRPATIEGVSRRNGETTKEGKMPNMQNGRGNRLRDDDRGSRFGGRARDEDGRFTSERRGRDERGAMRESSRAYEDDDRRRGSSMRARMYDDDRGRGRGRGGDGWSGDSRGHSESARRGRVDDGGDRSVRSRRMDDDDRGRGWHGDSRGHSEAAQRGWEDRGSPRSSRRDRDDDDRSNRTARSRDTDADRGRGRGGWFGDSRGHSEAARRGWESRH